jgi:serine protease Do
MEYRDPLYSFWGDDPFFQFFGGKPQQYKQQNRGSGTIISPDGYILTNDHVAGNGVEIMVTMTNGLHYKAKKIGSDPVSDVCLLKIEEKNLPYIKFGNSDDVIIGEWVVALGNPFGLFDVNNQPIVTVGVISAKGMNLEPVNNRYYLNMLQTDAAINGGNSGGPLINSVGELIGMNTLIYGSQGNIGIGFAIPINKINRIVGELRDKGKVDRDFWIGMRVQNIDDQIAKYYKLTDTRGVIVTYVEKNSPTYKAGVEVGDIITQVDNYKIQNDQTLVGIFQEFRTGQSIDLHLIRENNSLTKKMNLEKRND